MYVLLTEIFFYYQKNKHVYSYKIKQLEYLVTIWLSCKNYFFFFPFPTFAGSLAAWIFFNSFFNCYKGIGTRMRNNKQLIL